MGFRILIIGALLATGASSLALYPHELAYFNELAGGLENGHRHLLHSNQYWGQDFLFLKEWSRDHPEARPLFVRCRLLYDSRDLGIHTIEQQEYMGARPSASWYVLSTVELQRNGLLSPVSSEKKEVPEDKLSKRLRNSACFTRVGSSLYVYRIDTAMGSSE